MSLIIVSHNWIKRLERYSIALTFPYVWKPQAINVLRIVFYFCSLATYQRKKRYFLRVYYLKNANFSIFGHKITALAYFELIRYLAYVPHGLSIVVLVFIMTLAAGPRGASSSIHFSK